MIYYFILLLLISPFTYAADSEIDPAWNEAIQNLRSDNVRFNAMESYRALLRHFYNSNPEPSLISALEKTLTSDDYQQRQCATELLIRVHGMTI